MSLAPDHCRTVVGIQMLEGSRAVGGENGEKKGINEKLCSMQASESYNYYLWLYLSLIRLF